MGETITIEPNVYNKLPMGAILIRVETIQDMDRQERQALLVSFRDFSGSRKAHFCVETGEYLGDKL